MTVVTPEDFYTALEALKAAGYATAEYVGKDWATIESLLTEAGFIKIVNDAGVGVGYTKLFSSTAAATTTSTLGSTTSVMTATSVTATETGVAVSGAAIGGKAAGIVLTPKTAIICAVAGACGLAFGWDLGQYIQSEFFGDGDFDWSSDSIGGKVITYLTEDGTNYIDEDLAFRIKERLIEVGAYLQDAEIKYGEDGLAQSGKVYLKNNDNVMSLGDVLSLVPSQDVLTIFSGIVNNFSLDLNDTSSVYIAAWYTRSRYEIIEIFKIPIYEESYSNIKFDTFANWDPIKQVRTYTVDDTDNPAYLKLIIYGGLANHVVYRYLYDGYSRSYKSQSLGTPNNNTSNGQTSGAYNYGDGYVIGLYSSMISGIPGVSKQIGATIPVAGKSLIDTYPEWGTRFQAISNPNADDINGTRTLVPISIVATNDSTASQSDAQSGISSSESQKEQISTQPEVVEQTEADTSNEIPTNDYGDTTENRLPAIGIQGTGFVALYNPTQNQLADFSRYLWSNDFVTNIVKLFEDPMNAIIGLHMIYTEPIRGNDSTIVCGYLDSGVNSHTVSNQYKSIDCGTMKINTYFDNVLDYSPYTNIKCYLPFIGIIDLDTNDVIGGTVNIVYNIDVLTGACLAQVKVTRNDFSSVLYSYAGNCAIQLPITGGNYSSILANVIGVGASIGATIASGGALAPVAVSGVAAGVSNSKLNVSHSGSLGSNAGAMGIKIPYLIITRPTPAEASNYQVFYGKPSNKTVKLSECTGFTKVKDVHTSNINATDNELSEIESLLKEGVII